MQKTYLNRMLTSANPRHRKVAEILVARQQSQEKPSDRGRLAAKYLRITGKKADKRWSHETLVAKVVEAQRAAPADGHDA